MTCAFLGLALFTACGGDGGDSTADAGADPADSAPVFDAVPVVTGVISGTVFAPSAGGAKPNRGGPPPGVAGVTVRVIGTDTMTTTDSLGFYSLEAPVGPTYLRASLAEHWSGIIGVDHDESEATEVNVEVIPNALVANVDGQLTGTIDPADGVMFFRFETAYAGGGESVTTPTSDGAFTFGPKGPVEVGSLQAGGDLFVAIFGVPPGTPTFTVTGASGVNTCAPMVPTLTSFPVEAATFTNINIVCTPL